jgi:hypothetical protein
VRRQLRAVPAAVAVGALAFVAAACGAGSGPGVAALGNKSTGTTTAAAPAGSPGQVTSKVQAQLLAYSACMRRSGVPNFPDMKPGTNFPDPTFSPGASWTLPSGMHFRLAAVPGGTARVQHGLGGVQLRLAVNGVLVTTPSPATGRA